MSPLILAKLTRYSNGKDAELTCCVQNPKDDADDLGPGQHVPSLGSPSQWREDYAEGSLERTRRRARQEMRKRIVEGRLDHLVTLTTRENVTDYDESLVMLQAFVKLVHVSMPEWKYVAAPERQQRGAWHWHLAVHGWQKVEYLRECWYKASGSKGLQVEAPGRKGKRGTTYKWHPGRLAGYLFKYIAKELDERPTEMKGRHRYSTALGMRTWDESHHAFSVEATLEEILAWFSRTAGGIGKIWTDEWDHQKILWAST